MNILRTAADARTAVRHSIMTAIEQASDRGQTGIMLTWEQGKLLELQLTNAGYDLKWDDDKLQCLVRWDGVELPEEDSSDV